MHAEIHNFSCAFLMLFSTSLWTCFSKRYWLLNRLLSYSSVFVLSFKCPYFLGHDTFFQKVCNISVYWIPKKSSENFVIGRFSSMWSHSSYVWAFSNPSKKEEKRERIVLVKIMHAVLKGFAFIDWISWFLP